MTRMNLWWSVATVVVAGLLLFFAFNYVPNAPPPPPPPTDIVLTPPPLPPPPYWIPGKSFRSETCGARSTNVKVFSVYTPFSADDDNRVILVDARTREWYLQPKQVSFCPQLIVGTRVYGRTNGETPDRIVKAEIINEQIVNTTITDVHVDGMLSRGEGWYAWSTNLRSGGVNSPVYCGSYPAGTVSSIKLLNLKTGDETTMLESDTDGFSIDGWSEDGTKLVYSSFTPRDGRPTSPDNCPIQTNWGERKSIDLSGLFSGRE